MNETNSGGEAGSSDPVNSEDTVPKAIRDSANLLANALKYEPIKNPEELETFLGSIGDRTDALGAAKFEAFLLNGDPLDEYQKEKDEKKEEAGRLSVGEEDATEREAAEEAKATLDHLRRAFGQPLETYDLRKESARFFVLTRAALPPKEDESHDDLSKLYETAQTAYSSYVASIINKTTVPYFQLLGEKLKAVPPLVLFRRLTRPLMIDIIYSYWLETGMIYQSINAICRRFQNVDVPPLRFLNVSAIRGSAANQLLGFIEDEPHRLRPARRSAFYAEQLGVTLRGKAIPPLVHAEVRTRAMECFHEVLRLAIDYYREGTDLQKRPDPFPLVNPAKELQLALAEGANNQFGSLTYMARVELLIIQSLLGMPEIRTFLATRDMVAYPEPWIESLDAINRLMGWNRASALQFYELATRGERLMLALRYIPIMKPGLSNMNECDVMAQFLKQSKSDVQAYAQALQSVTGLDLGATTVTIAPSGTRRTLPARAR